MPLLELIIFAALAAVVLYQLYSVLGRRVGRQPEDQPQPETARDHAMQLLMVQRADGSLTIGDTHEYEHPFSFDTDEAPYEHLTGVVEGLLGRPLPSIRRRWAGVYAQCTDPGTVVHRAPVADGAWLVTGPGGRGMTCSPAIAETTANDLGW